MQKNDIVRVEIDGKLTKGLIVNINKNIITVGINFYDDKTKKPNYYEKEFEKRKVYRFYPLNKDEALIVHRNQFKDLYALIVKLQINFFPNIKVEISKENDLCIQMGNVSIGPATMEVPSIGRVSEQPAWSVDVVAYGDYEHGYPDVDVVDLGNYRYYTEAATTFIEAVFAEQAKIVMSDFSDDQYAKSILDDQFN
jgi:hypothetical protein